MIDKVEFPVFCEGCDPFLVAPIVEYSLEGFAFVQSVNIWVSVNVLTS